MIALIADIHGNFPALRAVLDEIKRAGASFIFSLGDVAGYYSMINECIELLIANQVTNVMGNHDYYLLAGMKCARSSIVNECIEYQRSVINPKYLSWLEYSPSLLKLDEMQLVHGGWRDSLEEYIYTVNDRYFEGIEGRYFFSGHTHIQCVHNFGEKGYCNPGSVGQPRDGDPRAAFALFDDGRIDPVRVGYDVDEVATHMKNSGFDKYYCSNLYSGEKIGERCV